MSDIRLIYTIVYSSYIRTELCKGSETLQARKIIVVQAQDEGLSDFGTTCQVQESSSSNSSGLWTVYTTVYSRYIQSELSTALETLHTQ